SEIPTVPSGAIHSWVFANLHSSGFAMLFRRRLLAFIEGHRVDHPLGLLSVHLDHHLGAVEEFRRVREVTAADAFLQRRREGAAAERADLLAFEEDLGAGPRHALIQELDALELG